MTRLLIQAFTEEGLLYPTHLLPRESLNQIQEMHS